MKLKLLLSVRLAAWILGSCATWTLAQPPGKGPVIGPTGGPYRVIAADFTGDKVLDLAIVYHAIGVVTVEKGDGRGQFSHVGLIEASVAPPSYTRGVYNLAHGDIDQDGLPDLVFAVHGTPPDGWTMKEIPLEVLQASWRGRVVIVRNMGQGRLQTMAEYATESMATGVRLADLDRDGHRQRRRNVSERHVAGIRPEWSVPGCRRSESRRRAGHRHHALD